MKYLTLLTTISASLIITGCQSTTKKDIEWVKTYDSQKHGELMPGDKILEESIAECSKTAFNEGITINGKLVTNGEEIISAYNKHKVKYALDKTRQLNKAPNNSEAQSIGEEYASNAPQYIREVHKRKHIYDKCFYDEKGFSTFKRKIPYDKSTGQRLWLNPATNTFEVDNTKY